MNVGGANVNGPQRVPFNGNIGIILRSTNRAAMRKGCCKKACAPPRRLSEETSRLAPELIGIGLGENFLRKS